jgi:transcriptional regulator with XRE-family HTH domain
MSGFHVRLNDFIGRSGMTLDEISVRSGVSTKTIQNWTRNASPTMPRIDQGVMVAQVLGVSAEYLVTGKAPGGLSEKGLKVALAAEQLSDEGKNVALTQVEGLAVHFPLGVSASSKTAT